MNPNLLNSDDWFKSYPEKILGTQVETGQFRRPISVKGSRERIHEIAAEYQYKLTMHTNAYAKAQARARALILTAKAKSTLGKVATLTTYSFDDILQLYNPGLSEDQIRVWVWYQRQYGQSLKGGWQRYETAHAPVQDWLKRGLLCQKSNGYQPAVLYYSGNLYERMADLESIRSTMDEAQYFMQREKLEKLLPPRLSLNEPLPEKRLQISPISDFARQFMVRELTDGSSYGEDTGKSLRAAFADWLYSLPQEAFEKDTNGNEIVSYYLNSARFRKGTDDNEKAKIKQNVRMEGERLFQRFLYELLHREDQLKIEQQWNSTYNGIVEVDYAQIPVGFECSRTFKGLPLDIRPAQREGVAFQSVYGTGIVAYDVGVGKTLTAILAVAQALQAGHCQRPLIVVPNPTYKKWLYEISQILPQYPLNDWYNLGSDVLAASGGKLPKPQAGSITVVTYEGFMRIGFGDKTEKELLGELVEILNQGSTDHREAARLQQKIKEIIGVGLRNTVLDIEALGVDFLVIDEAHNMKKSFTRVKGEVKGDERDRSPYEIASGEPSARAIKAFLVAQFNLRHNRYRNVLLLTATPFTNSPLEIYSMLALVSYQKLRSFGIHNIKQFFDTFVNESYELKYTAKMKFEIGPVIKGFRNRIILQNLIYNFINYKTGEEANIQRPNKVVLPLMNQLVDGQLHPLPKESQVSTYLPPNLLQAEYLKEVEAYVSGQLSLDEFCMVEDFDIDAEEGDLGCAVCQQNLSGPGKMEDPGRLLRGISYARMIALSPHFYPCKAQEKLTPRRFVEDSPKILYTMRCIQTVKRWHEERKEPVSGQVIYMNAGISKFPLLKAYLVEQVGYKEAEVGLIYSGISAARKEKIKEDFNRGEIKVIIGSATIKEGIDLQNRSTVLYNLWLDWNPTDLKQLEGRIWRFGNEFANVRIVYPLLEDSLDVFMFQKLEEKTARINDIWHRAGRENVLKLEELNPEELKYGLIQDPAKLARMQVQDAVEARKFDLKLVESRFKTVSEAGKLRENYYSYLNRLKDWVHRQKPEADTTTPGQLLRVTGALLKQRYDYYINHSYLEFRSLKAKMDAMVKGLLQPNGYSIEDDLQPLTNRYMDELVKLREEIDHLESRIHFERVLAEVVEEKRKRSLESRDLNYRVAQFARLNSLLAEKKVYQTALPPLPAPNADKLKAQAKAKALILIAKAKAA